MLAISLAVPLSIALSSLYLPSVLLPASIPLLELTWQQNHPSFGNSTSYSPTLSGDGAYLAATWATTRDTVVIYQASNGSIVRTIDGEAEITGIAWSPTEDLVAGVSASEPIPRPWTGVYLWSTTGSLLQRIQLDRPSLWPTVSWSPSGGFLAVVTYGTSDQIDIFSLGDDGVSLVHFFSLSLPYDLQGYRSLEWSPDGSHASLVANSLRPLADGGPREMLFAWSVPSFGLLHETEVAAKGTWQPLSWSPEGSRFALLIRTAENGAELQIRAVGNSLESSLDLPSDSRSVAWISPQLIAVGTDSGHIVLVNGDAIQTSQQLVDSGIIFVLPAFAGTHLLLMTLENGLLMTELV